MVLRVRKSIKIMPGVRVNISKSGISTSIGVKGATVNLKPGRKARVTVGIPGTGLSYTSTASSAPQLATPAPTGISARRLGQLFAICVGALGLAFCTKDLVFGLLMIGGAIILYRVCRAPKVQHEIDQA